MKRSFVSLFHASAWLLALCLSLAVVTVGCPGPGPEGTEQTQDSGETTAPDKTPDSTPAPDATPDAAPDAAPDVAPDKTPDAGPDVTPDTTPIAAFTLQLLHASDQESDGLALTDAVHMSSMLNAMRKKYPETTLTLSSGDLWLPGPIYQASDTGALEGVINVLAKGRADMILNNAFGFQAVAFGNHEFDEGTAAIKAILAAEDDNGKKYPGASFPYLSANLDFSADGNLKDLIAEDGKEAKDIPGKIAKYVVITVKGEKIGIVGATTPTIGTISSPGADVKISPDKRTDLDALAAIIQTSVDALKDKGINKIILLAHMQQIQREKDLATKLKDVDIIVAGGSDTILADDNDRLRAGDTAADKYPIWLQSASSEPVAVVNTDGQYRYIGRLVVGFDDKGLLIKGSVDAKESGAYATDAQGAKDLGDEPPHPDAKTVADALKGVIVSKDGNIMGKTSVYLNGLRGSVRTEETNLGNLTADANLYVAKQHDSKAVISIKNGGGIRDAIGVIYAEPGSVKPPEKKPPVANPVANKKEGDISQLDIENTLKFNNKLVLLTLTATQLKEVIEHGVSAWAPDKTPGSFCQVGGLRFSFDPTKAAGSRVQTMAVIDDQGQVTDVVVENGAVKGDATRTFRVVTLDYLAGGGDGYPFKTYTDANAAAVNRVDLVDALKGNDGNAKFASPGTEQDALAEYLKDKYSTTAYGVVDTEKKDDTRIQNLSFRKDEVNP